MEFLPPRAATCYCAQCGEYMNSVAAFDKHLYYKKNATKPSCLTVIEMLADGMSRNDRGLWVTRAYDGPARGERDAAA